MYGMDILQGIFAVYRHIAGFVNSKLTQSIVNAEQCTPVYTRLCTPVYTIGCARRR